MERDLEYELYKGVLLISSKRSEIAGRSRQEVHLTKLVPGKAGDRNRCRRRRGIAGGGRAMAAREHANDKLCCKCDSVICRSLLQYRGV